MAQTPAKVKHKGVVKLKTKKKFLKALTETGVVGLAARQAGKAASFFYKERKDDPEFAAQWEAAKEYAVDLAEDELRRRALQGAEEDVIFKGDRQYEKDPFTGEFLLDKNGQPIPLRTRKNDTRALEIFLKANRRDKFGDQKQVTMQVDSKIEVSQSLGLDALSADDRAALLPILQRQLEAKKAQDDAIDAEFTEIEG